MGGKALRRWARALGTGSVALPIVLAGVVAMCPAPARAADVYVREGFSGVADGAVVVMPPDIRLFEVTTAGRFEPRDDWTEAGKSEVATALGAELAARGITAEPYREPGADSERNRAHAQVRGLFGLVAQTILVHYVDEKQRLPSMNGRFAWTLGPDAAVLADDHSGARFGLWVSFGDGYSSAGRRAMNAAAAIVGGTLVWGRQVGHAALVELKTGDIVWFARRISSGSSGDLRTPDGARNAVHALLEALPR